VLVACSPQAPAQNVASDQNAVPAQSAPEQQTAAQQTTTIDIPSYPDDKKPQSGLREVPLTIHSRNGVHQFTVEVAASPQEQERGLMFRKSVAPDRGMIFPYAPPQEVAFWMKNTLIPLDIVYIDANGKIARIAHAEALNLEPIPSGVPVSGVLELRAGRTAELGIREGDKVSWTL
jgi:uncharacterized membrane protein (UPF0127 family)